LDTTHDVAPVVLHPFPDGVWYTVYLVIAVPLPGEPGAFQETVADAFVGTAVTPDGAVGGIFDDVWADSPDMAALVGLVATVVEVVVAPDTLVEEVGGVDAPTVEVLARTVSVNMPTVTAGSNFRYFNMIVPSNGSDARATKHHNGRSGGNVVGEPARLRRTNAQVLRPCTELAVFDPGGNRPSDY
jgi:hypothetical protein